MSKLVLSDVTNINSITTINANFEKIQEELQEKVLYRDNPDGEPNHMLDNLDMNGNKIINAGEVRVGSLVINGVPVEPGTGVTTASAFQVYEYTATEGQTAFSVAPHTPFVASLQVEVNGLSYPPSGYDVSGTDVIIPSASAGDEIVIRRFVNAPTTIPTAEDITFIQSGAGAVARTGQDKMREWVTTSDHSTVQNSLTEAAGSELRVLPGGLSVSSALIPAANTKITGCGPGSLISTSTVSTHVISATNGGATVRDLSLQGVKGTTVLDNSAVAVGGSYNAVERIDASGMSGMAVYLTGSTDSRVAFSRIHGLTPDSTYINGCDVGLYTSNSYGQVLFNTLEGGAQTEVGVLMQLNSIKHLVAGNNIKAHTSYGVLDYDTTPRRTGSIITANRIENIDGSLFGGNKGAGIYAAGTGGQVIGFNQVSNTNIGTTTESLAPGAVGINNPYAPLAIAWNVIDLANWYGVIVTSSTTSSINIGGNVITEADKGSVYIKSSSHANVHGGVYEQLTTTPLTARGVAVNIGGGGPFTGVSVHGNRIRGSVRGIEIGFTNNSLANNNNISEVNGIGIRLTDAAGVACVGNVVDVTTGSGAALDISNLTYSTISGNVFKGTSSTVINISGACTGTRFDKSNILVGMTVNNINNAGSGCIVEVYGTAPPTILNHQVGDRVINSAPAVGSPKAWRCTVAGIPGTWVSEGNL